MRSLEFFKLLKIGLFSIFLFLQYIGKNNLMILENAFKWSLFKFKYLYLLGRKDKRLRQETLEYDQSLRIIRG